MARCNLDVENPKFLQLVGDLADDDAFRSGFKELSRKLERDHRLSGWVSHPMPKYPEYQNKIWKWDFAPAGEKSSTRKGWRIYAHVENPDGPEPITAIPFLVYPKPGPKGDHVKYVVEALKTFLAAGIKIQAVEARYRRVYAGNRVHSSCLTCWEHIESANDADADISEDTHVCSGNPF